MSINMKKVQGSVINAYHNGDLPAVTVSYPDFKILRANKRAWSYLKEKDMKASEVLLNFPSYIKTDLISEMVESGKPVYSRNNRILLGANEMYFNFIYHPFFHKDNNKIIRFMIIFEDITKDTVEKNQFKETMKYQEEFFSFITHEFRTPLNTIYSTLQLLELVYNDEMTENIKRYINNIKRNTFQQLRLVNNLLDISKAESGYLLLRRKNYDIITLTKTIVDSVRNFAELRSLDIQFCTNLKERLIAIDEEKYERILLNLLSNAIKFTPEGKNIFVTVSSNDGNIIICVKDQGIGISESDQQIVFNKFKQSGNKLIKNCEGSGIGLYLVKLLVETMGGKITLFSEEGKGSSFIVKLPILILENEANQATGELSDSHIVQSIQMEFSQLYDL